MSTTSTIYGNSAFDMQYPPPFSRANNKILEEISAQVQRVYFVVFPVLRAIERHFCATKTKNNHWLMVIPIVAVLKQRPLC